MSRVRVRLKSFRLSWWRCAGSWMTLQPPCRSLAGKTSPYRSDWRQPQTEMIGLTIQFWCCFASLVKETSVFSQMWLLFPVPDKTVTVSHAKVGGRSRGAELYGLWERLLCHCQKGVHHTHTHAHILIWWSSLSNGSKYEINKVIMI